MKRTGFIKLVAVTIMMICFTSCEKPEGPGGKATITGKVYARDYDNQQYYVYGKGYAAGERVYICYGKDSKVIGNDTRTGLDGTFEFRHLNKGSYTIFVNSVDTAQKNKGNDRMIPVVRYVKITGTSQVVTLDDIIINQ
jgi:hypothetical protein